jgi:hypothetical protein
MYTIKIRITETGRKSPVVILKGKELKTNSAKFYINSEANISIKKSKLYSSIKINKGTNKKNRNK